MITMVKTAIWQQFGASMDMLEDAITNCPEPLWTGVLWEDSDDPRYGQFWFVAYHTLFWIDLYLSGRAEDFVPPKPFILGAFPETPYTKDDIVTYLSQCRQKCRAAIETMTDEEAHRVCTYNWMEKPFLELQIYSMRHVQEHTSQLHYFLGQNGISVQEWLSTTRDHDPDKVLT
jgi:hypothetical protein